MNDERDIRGELNRLAVGDPLGPIDSGYLLDRGRRGRRRRRIVAGGSAVAVVSAMAFTAALLPNLSSADAPPAAGDSSRKIVADFAPLPGVARGDAAFAPIDRAEMFRRCALRGVALDPAGEFLGGEFPAWYPVGNQKVMMHDSQRRARECAIPGDSRPSDATIAEAKANPLPSDDATRLRNCSVELWHDVTKYRVLTSDAIAGKITNFVAMSPSGRYVVFCTLQAGQRRIFHDQNVAYLVANVPHFAGHERADRLGVGGQTCLYVEGKTLRQECIGTTYSGAGRWNPRITRIVINNSNGNKHEIKLNDGWYALAWANGNRENPDDRATAYDANGNVVPINKSNDPGPLAPPLR